MTKIPSILDPERPRKKRKKRKKRKVDYTELLQPPIIPSVPCPHTRRAQDASMCSQCQGIKPSIIHKPQTVDWWVDDDVEINISVDAVVIPDED